MTHLVSLNDSMSCVEKSGSMLCPCTIELASLEFRLPGLDGKEARVTLGTEELLEVAGEAQWSDGTTAPICMVGIQTNPQPFAILGDVFLRKLYAVHNVEKRQITVFERDPKAEADAGQGTLRPMRPMMPVFMSVVLFVSILAALWQCR